jgi:hypothetical protein
MTEKKKVKAPVYYHMKFWNEEKKVFEMGEARFSDFKDMALAAIGWMPIGNTESALRALVTALQWVKDAQDLSGNKKEFMKHAVTRTDVFGKWEYLIFQVLKEKGLLDGVHSLPGIVSETGKEILKALSSYFEKLDKENTQKVK